MNLKDLNFIDMNIKGVIKVVEYSKGKYKVIALKKGEVLLSGYENKFDSRPKLDVHFKVLDNKLIHSWVCKEEFIKCIGDIELIDGYTSDRSVFKYARDYCSKRKSCFFSLKLDRFFLQKFNREASEYAKFNTRIHKIFMQSSGHMIVSLDCSFYNTNRKKNDIRQDLTLRFGFKNIQFKCEEKFQLDSYLAYGKIVLIKKHHIERYGLESNWSFPLLGKNEFISDIGVFLNMLTKQKKSKVIGQPQLTLLPFKKTAIHSGGEFSIDSYSRNEAHKIRNWKKYGVKLEIEIQEILETAVSIKFHFSLKLAEKSGSARLSVHEMNGYANLELNKDSILGRLKYQNQSDTIQKPFVAKVPIIGPLLQSKRMNFEDSFVFLILKIINTRTSSQ